MTEKKPKVVFVAGARPNFMKVAPLLEASDALGRWHSLLVHTGQHYDRELSDLFFDQLHLRSPDRNLGVGSGSHASQTAQIMLGFEGVVLEQRPDLVVVVGDVNSTLACALVAAKLGIRIAHVEAGLRSFDRTMPEEINRLLTDALADYLFSTEPEALENLQREGIPADRVFLVGNVMIDTLQRLLPVARKSGIHERFGLERSTTGAGVPYALLTLHRPSNVDDPERLSQLVRVIRTVAERVPVIFPVHPRTRSRLGALGVNEKDRGAGLHLTPPLGYLDFLALMHRATFVMTDSGGIQEETTALGVPCLTLRDTTERPVTVRQGTNEVVGRQPDKILGAVERVLSGHAKRGRVPDLWDGKAAERIVCILAEKLD